MKFIANLIIKEIKKAMAISFDDLTNELNQNFYTMSNQINELKTQVTTLESKLVSKDFKDKQSYGHLTYKIEELKNEKPKN